MCMNLINGIKSLEKHYKDKIKREKEVVQKEYDFWRCIELMANGESDNVGQKYVKILKNNGQYDSSFNTCAYNSFRME